MEESAPVEPDRQESSTRTEPKADVIYGVVVGTLYVLAVGVQVFLVVDEVTHGALSTQVGTWWREWTAQLRERRRVAAEFRIHRPWVLWDALEATVEAAAQEGDEP